MLEVKIYQTLEDRGNDEEIESHGPYKCLSHTGNGLLKKGVKEPWLGEGYYFWDTKRQTHKQIIIIHVVNTMIE